MAGNSDWVIKEAWPPRNAADLLFTAKWCPKVEISNMSECEKRAAIVVELAKLYDGSPNWSDPPPRQYTDPVVFMEAKSTEWLIGAGALYLILKRTGWLSFATSRGGSKPGFGLMAMACVDRVDQLSRAGYGKVSDLERLDYMALAQKAWDFHQKTNRIESVIDVQLHLDQAKILSNKPEILGRGTYDNQSKREKLRQTFSWDKTFTERESLSFSKEFNCW